MTTPDLESVLFDFADTDGPPTAARLNDFVERFPPYAKDLTDFAVELALLASDSTLEGTTPPPEVNDLVAQGVSNYLNHAEKRRAKR